MIQKLKTVIPAYAGIQLSKRSKNNSPRLLKTFVRWIPAFAGMTMLMLLCTLIFTLYTSPVYAACDPNAPDSNFGPCPAGLKEIEGIVANVISVIVGLGFIAMLVLVLWAGIKYLTSGGEPKAIQAAHQTLTWALLGIFFLVLAWVVLQLIQALTGVNVTVFNIKTLCTLPGTTFDFCKQ